MVHSATCVTCDNATYTPGEINRCRSDVPFELPDETADAIKTTGANNRFDFGFALRNYPVDFQIHNQFAINDATVMRHNYIEKHYELLCAGAHILRQ